MPAQASGSHPLTLRGVRLPNELDEAMIHDVVHGFYGRIRADDLLGPVFAARIADDQWPVHLGKMCDFWSATILRTDRYGGRPLPPHLRIEELDDSHFNRWLMLFRDTVDERCDRASAAIFFDFARRIARSFRMAVAFHRGEDSTMVAPLPIEESLEQA